VEASNELASALLGAMSVKDPSKMTVVFTKGYAPPEQILGRPEPRSDLFALAATLYHLATGKEPSGYHTAKEIEALLKAPASPIAPQDRWFFELLRINLAESPEERYYSAAEFKADLEREAVTKEVICPSCRQVNEVRQPYCSRCAEPLTPLGRSCRHCGKEGRMGCRWCIYCGKRVG
jgi:serine/threonine protein kinase